MKIGCRISLWMILQLTVVMALVCRPTVLEAGDWPQILGPNRDGRASDERLAGKFPPDGPFQVWELRVGEGFAGVAIVGDRGILFHRVKNQEEVLCFEAQTGAQVWATQFAASYQGGIEPDNGPRCVPLVHENRVIVFGAAGQMHCLALADGATLWTRELYRDFKGSEGYFGAGSTPLVWSV